jgi:hypothetical protein
MTTTDNLPTKPILPQEEPADFKAAYDKIVQIDSIIDLESLNPNSVVVIKLGGEESHRIRMHQAFVKFLYGKQELFRQKKLTVLFLDNTDDMTTLDEKEMNAAGWFKKEKSLIIKP